MVHVMPSTFSDESADNDIKCAAPMVTAVLHNDEWHASAHTQQACVKPGVLQLQGGICICLQQDRGAAAKERGWIAGAAIWRGCKGARSD